jgi:hypothetical protein
MERDASLRQTVWCLLACCLLSAGLLPAVCWSAACCLLVCCLLSAGLLPAVYVLSMFTTATFAVLMEQPAPTSFSHLLHESFPCVGGYTVGPVLRGVLGVHPYARGAAGRRRDGVRACATTKPAVNMHALSLHKRVCLLSNIVMAAFITALRLNMHLRVSESRRRPRQRNICARRRGCSTSCCANVLRTSPCGSASWSSR